MSLPPLPKAACPRAGTRQPDDLFDSGQMREYGQQCYEQGKADAAKGNQIVSTPTFAPFDAEDDLK